MRTIGKKPFLLGALAALLILALCAVPLLASSPVYAGDKASGGGKASTADSKGSSAGSKAPQGKAAGIAIIELDTGALCINGENCFSATISPNSVPADQDDVAFTLTYKNCGTSFSAPKQVKFKTEVPSCFDDIKVGETDAVSYDGAAANWTSWLDGSWIVSQADDLENDAICGSSFASKRGWVEVDFTADTPECVGYLDLDPEGPTDVTAGEAFDLDVTARTCDGDKWDDYGGTVSFSSSDGIPYPADLPEDYEFDNFGSGDDHGDHHFNNGATLYTAGVQTITVEDSATYCLDFEFEAKGYKQDSYEVNPPGPNNSYTVYCIGDQDTQSGCEPVVEVCGPLCSDTEEFTVEPGCATNLDLEPDGGNTAEPGVPFDVTVTLYDNWDNIVTHYAGTVSFSSDHVGAALPGAYPFVPASDMGFHTFSGVTLYDFGTWTITAEGTGYEYNCHEVCVGKEWVGGCGGHWVYIYETVCDQCGPPAPDDEDWTLEEPEEPEVPPPPEEEPGPLSEGAAPGAPVLVVDVQGTVARYPVTLDGKLLVNATTTSPDGLITLFIPSGCPVLNADSTPAYLNQDPDVFSIVAADLAAPAGSTILTACQIQPAGVIFSCDATIVMQYDPNKLPAGATPVIAAYNAASGQWTDLETAGYVAGGVEVPNTLQAQTSNAYYFAILAQ